MRLLALLPLAACAGDAATGDSAVTEACTDPEVTMDSPTANETFAEGETVTLIAEGESTGSPRYSWAVDGDLFETGSTGTWTAETPGDRVMTVQLDDDCGSVQASTTVRVVAAE